MLGALLVLSLGLVVLFPAWGISYLLALIVLGSIGHFLLGLGMPGRFLARLDDLLYDGERALVATALMVMSAAVFVDVSWRTSHSLEGNTARGFVVAGLFLCLMGGATVRWPSATRAKRLGAGLAAFVVLSGVIALIHAAPNGFGWSQRLSLALLLWVGFLGGSMATKQGLHIAVDAVRRVVPARLKRSFEVAGGVVTVALSAFLTWLGVLYAHANWTDWVESEHQAGVFESLPIPYWTASMPIAIGFGLMTARFLGLLLTGPKEVDLLTSVGGSAMVEPAGDAK